MSISKNNLLPASQWIYNQYLELNQNLDNQLQAYELAHSVEALYDFLWNKLANWYLEYLKVNDSDLGFAKALYQDFVCLSYPYLPFEAEVIWRDIFQESQPLSRQVRDTSFLQAYEIDDSAILKFQNVINLITELRSLRGLFNIDPGTKLEIYLQTKELETYSEYISLVGRTSLSLNKEGKAYQVKKAGFEFCLDILSFVKDVEAEAGRAKKLIQDLQKTINGLQKQLQNPKFADQAPAEIIQEKKQALEFRLLDLQTQKNKLEILLKS